MLNEIEIAQLDAIIEAYGLVETVRAIADRCEARVVLPGLDWAMDAMRLRKVAKSLLNGRDK